MLEKTKKEFQVYERRDIHLREGIKHAKAEVKKLQTKVTTLTKQETTAQTKMENATKSIPELENVIVSTALRAPDGYEFQGHSRRAGFVAEIFAGDRSRSAVTVVKDGAVVRVRLPTSRSWYQDVSFLGWVTN